MALRNHRTTCSFLHPCWQISHGHFPLAIEVLLGKRGTATICKICGEIVFLREWYIIEWYNCQNWSIFFLLYARMSLILTSRILDWQSKHSDCLILVVKRKHFCIIINSVLPIKGLKKIVFCQNYINIPSLTSVGWEIIANEFLHDCFWGQSSMAFSN